MKYIATCGIVFMACSADDHEPITRDDPSALAAAPGLALGALDGAARTIPYGGYVDFDGEPVNAGSVRFNFALFACAPPATCAPLWVARGTIGAWGTSDEAVSLPIFAGRFAVELGGEGQNPLPDEVFTPDDTAFYLGVRIEGRTLGGLQKLVPTTRARTALHARLADEGGDFTLSGDLVMQGGVATGLRLDHLAAPPVACNPGALGHVYFDTTRAILRVCDGDAWADVQSKRARSTSCKDLLAQGHTSDGMYTITPKVGGPAVAVYCDMTTDGGGWTLVSYSHRAALGSAADLYAMPTSFSPGWDAGARANIAVIDARELIRNGAAVALTTTTGGAPVTGNIKSYTTAHTWPLQNPTSVSFGFEDQATCADVYVRDLHTDRWFNAVQQRNRMTVSCSGTKGGTQYERTMVGFSTYGCYGVCGADPADSMGMTVWYANGYCPTTSGGNGCPERAGSMALWIK